MKSKTSSSARLSIVITSLLVFATWQCLANTIELDWTSASFSSSHITITTGDEVDIVNLDDTFDLQLTGSPAPNNFYSDIPPFDGDYYYYLPYVYVGSGSHSACPMNSATPSR